MKNMDSTSSSHLPPESTGTGFLHSSPICSRGCCSWCVGPTAGSGIVPRDQHKSGCLSCCWVTLFPEPLSPRGLPARLAPPCHSASSLTPIQSTDSLGTAWAHLETATKPLFHHRPHFHRCLAAKVRGMAAQGWRFPSHACPSPSS